jgi:hypothetical protein
MESKIKFCIVNSVQQTKAVIFRIFIDISYVTGRWLVEKFPSLDNWKKKTHHK